METRQLFYTILLGICSIVGSLSWKMRPQLRPVILLLWTTLICETVAWFAALYFRNSMPIHHVALPLYTLIWAWFYSSQLVSKRSKVFVKSSFVFILLFSVGNTAFVQGFLKFPSVVFITLSMLMIIWASLLLLQLIDSPSERNIFREPVFYVTVGVLWFNLLSFLYFLLHDYLSRTGLAQQSLHLLHYISNMVYYGLLLLAMIMSYLSLQHEQRNKH